ncbi:alpha/beta fold hydrolase [Undibacterium terreum]|uniref:Alpha/beta hydrolase n=1 Tax=Undibacterium terreum TaxID=1224302 RepID=A0A916XH64_9BURK|nr:alpha/beta hydrolase [Undibacterium terreum]GGC73215.1 alpha/beta hydrolase [Undibacterium terreum]
MNRIISSIAIAVALAQAVPAIAAKNVVLVHGAFADGSGWRDVAEILEAKGYRVTVVQHPETSLEEDVTAVKRVLAAQDGPVVLVGHSYGGLVITQAGSEPKVSALVFVAAYAPDEGESAAVLRQKLPPASTASKRTPDGYLQLDPAMFHQDFAADLPAKTAHFMSISQVLPNAAAFSTKISNPAWKSKPSWGIVATEDRAINPELERFMYKRGGFTVTEIKSSHAVYISRPAEVAAVIEEAASKN